MVVALLLVRVSAHRSVGRSVGLSVLLLLVRRSVGQSVGRAVVAEVLGEEALFETEFLCEEEKKEARLPKPRK